MSRHILVGNQTNIAMKRLILFILILLLLRQWFIYSDPGSFSREEIAKISSFTTLEDIIYSFDIEEAPQLVHASVVHAGGFRKAGYCILQEDGVQLLVLSRGFPPSRAQLIDCIIIPRRLMQIGSHYVVIAAMVAFQPAPLSEKTKEKKRALHSHF